MRSMGAIFGYAVLIYFTWKWIELAGDWVVPVIVTGSLFLVGMYIALIVGRK